MPGKFCRKCGKEKEPSRLNSYLCGKCNELYDRFQIPSPSPVAVSRNLCSKCGMEKESTRVNSKLCRKCTEPLNGYRKFGKVSAETQLGLIRGRVSELLELIDQSLGDLRREKSRTDESS